MTTARFLAIVAALSIIGCSASGQSFRHDFLSPEPGMSKIFVYRINQFVGKGYTADIVIDGELMGELKNGGYISRSVSPGRHVVEIDKSLFETGGRYPTTLDMQAGQTYFVRYDQRGQVVSYGVGVSSVVRDGFSVVPAAQAVEELRDLKASE